MQRILIVDDEPAILLAISSYLTTSHSDVHIAEDFVTADGLLAANEYDAVITDLRLGGDDETEGLQIIRLVRERQPRAKTILLTAYGSPTVEAEAIALGVDRYVQKPIGLLTLSQMITHLVSSGGTPA